MIIIARRYGQLGNRLTLASHLIAAAQEYGIGFAHPTFAEYANYFQGTAHDLWCRFPQRAKSGRSVPVWQRRLAENATRRMENTLWYIGMRKFPCQLSRLKDGTHCDLLGQEFQDLVSQGRPLLINGWDYRSNRLLHKHGDAIRAHFQPIERHQQQVDLLIAEIRRNADLVVGIHMRHGDFKTYNGGRYYYPVEAYRAAMFHVIERFPDRQISFLVCTDGTYVPDDFHGLRAHPGTGHLIEDLYALANTDFMIASPGSTFSAWASFYGKTPLVKMDTVDLSEIEQRWG